MSRKNDKARSVMTSGGLLWRLLRRNISVRQIAGYGVANLIGLTILMIALQFYRDVTTPVGDGEDGFINSDYLILSRQVSEMGTLLGSTTTFTPAEIDDLRCQPWCKAVGEFTPARFHVSAAVDFGGRRMSTHLFFEAIPDKFFDKLPSGWTFDPSDARAEIPIVLSKDYLALYNFGFAASRNMPQISAKTVSRIPLEISLSGNGLQEWRIGRVVGFSSRLNTIAVPEQFMQWANETFGDPHSGTGEISRLIVEVKDPGSPAVKRYFEEHSIEVAGDKERQGRMAYLMGIVSMVVMTVGALITLLSFAILFLSIMLLLTKNASVIHRLLMLGYSTREVARPYIRLVCVINGTIGIIASILTVIASRLWATPLESLEIEGAPVLPAIVAGIGLMICVTVLNILVIKRIVRRNFYA